MIDVFPHLWSSIPVVPVEPPTDDVHPLNLVLKSDQVCEVLDRGVVFSLMLGIYTPTFIRCPNHETSRVM